MHIFLFYTVCDRRIDIIAVVDGRNNEADFSLMRKTLTTLVSNLRISESRVRFGLVLNSNDVTARLPLIGNKAQILDGIQKLTRPQDGRRIDKGNSMLIEMFL